MKRGTITIEQRSESSNYTSKVESIAKRLTNKNKHRVVKFSPTMEINIFNPILDPETKKSLYYTRHDIWLFQKRVDLAIALRSQTKSAKRMQIRMQTNRAYHDYLKQDNVETAERYHKHAGSASSVKFSSNTAIGSFEPIVDPETKKSPYYTRDDLSLFRKRAKIDATLRRQIKDTKETQIKINHLTKQKNFASPKRVLKRGSLASGTQKIVKRQRF